MVETGGNKIMTDRTKEEIVKEIESIVEKSIQPSVEMHGGVVKLQDFDMETGVALMLMSGACSGCASSTVTLKLGVETVSYTHLTLPTICSV